MTSGLTHRLFLECQKDRVEEFKILEVVVNHIIEFHPLHVNQNNAFLGVKINSHRSPSLFGAKRVVETMSPNSRYNLLQH